MVEGGAECGCWGECRCQGPMILIQVGYLGQPLHLPMPLVSIHKVGKVTESVSRRHLEHWGQFPNSRNVC